jgi:hypothetical protein
MLAASLEEQKRTFSERADVADVLRAIADARARLAALDAIEPSS